jgi:hypothetical protein
MAEQALKPVRSPGPHADQRLEGAPLRLVAPALSGACTSSPVHAFGHAQKFRCLHRLPELHLHITMVSRMLCACSRCCRTVHKLVAALMAHAVCPI